MDIVKWLSEFSTDLWRMDGYDSCIIGVIENFYGISSVCYDYEKVIAKSIKDGMTEEEAVEHYSYNQAGAYIGKASPVFLHKPME